MNELWNAFSNMMYAAVSVGARIGNKPAGVPRASGSAYGVWGRSIARLALISAFLPIPLVAIGAIFGWSTVVASIGVFWMIWTAILGLTVFPPFAPLAILADFFIRESPEEKREKQEKGGQAERRQFSETTEGQWLVAKFWRFFFWIFLVEAAVAEYISVFQLSKNLSLVPLAILSALSLAMITGIKRRGATFRRIATLFAAATLIVCTLTFAIPNDSPAFENFKKGAGRGSERALGMISHLVSLDWTRRESSAEPRGELAQYPFCAGAEKGKLEVERENATHYLDDLHPDCWSKRISLPPGITFRLEPDVPGFVEYWFWNGTRVLAHKDQSLWMGNVPHSIFRLRADGPASLIVEVPDEEPEEDVLEDENG